MLQKKNYSVKHASTGAEGIQMVDEGPLSMIIFDTKLPDLQAVDLLERLQKNPKIVDIPCVVLSSKSDPEEMKACLEAGCSEYFIKSGIQNIS